MRVADSSGEVKWQTYETLSEGIYATMKEQGRGTAFGYRTFRPVSGRWVARGDAAVLSWIIRSFNRQICIGKSNQANLNRIGIDSSWQKQRQHFARRH